MEKRLILAIVISSFVLLLWSAITPKPVYKPQQAPATVSTAAMQAETLGAAVPDDKIAVPAVFAEFSNAKIKAIFEEDKAALKEVIFKDYQNYKFPLYSGLETSRGFKQFGQSADSITFRYVDAGKEIIKKFIFSNSNYSIELEIQIRNLTNTPLNFSYPLILGAINFAIDPAKVANFNFTVATPEKLLHPNAHKDSIYNSLKFMGLRERYFCIIASPVSGSGAGFIKKISSTMSEIGISSGDIMISPGAAITQKYSVYLGPQELKFINPVNSTWAGIVHFGTFDIISQILLKLLEIFYGLVHNWGLAIIILSIVVYLILYPLSIKQMRSMKEMQALQPRIEELRKTYKDNPQRLNKEIMELYREHKVNPLGGCLPLLLQMPIFFALYQALLRSVSLKGSGFLWIKDLSEPDRLFVLPSSLPILGTDINLLPILMMIGMFIQQKFTMSASGSGNNEQQKIMLIVFPLIFGFIFYRMPSGLVLYWFINSMLMLVFQLKISRQK